MNVSSYLAFGAAVWAIALALAAIIRKRNSIATWSFCAGMIIFALENAFHGISFSQAQPEKLRFWQTLAFESKSFLPGVWLCFSLTFSRGNYRESLRGSLVFLVLAFGAPAVLMLRGSGQLLEFIPGDGSGSNWWLGYSATAKTLNALLLITTVLILMNLERTFRSAVGTMQWRLKFVVLGLGVIFGARIYTRSQALIYSGEMLAGSGIETAALLLGCSFIVVGYVRGGFGEIDIYPSRAALHTSLTVLLAGAYLFVVGVLAQIVARTGTSGNFQLQALLILVGIALLAVLLLSKRLRQILEQFISRHFTRPRHDFRKIWSRFTGFSSSVLDQNAISHVSANLISDTFEALSVTIWLFDKREEKLAFAASTSQSARELDLSTEASTSDALRAELKTLARPFELEKARGEWSSILRKVSEPQFRDGGKRLCVPLREGEHFLGFIVLADRVNGAPYTVEEFDLLECIGDQVAASLLNSRLTEEVMFGKELEAFQTISAFFVHDLKNAASTLTLMLQNLPVHFDDPAFRADALRGIGRTADRINQLISSLSVVREKLALHPEELDLNQVLEEALHQMNGVPALAVVRDLKPLPKVVADRQQLQSVVTNLLVNAREAVAENGTVTVQTSQRGEWATVSVTDDGCGMTSAFVRDSLFRPFSTTKKKGLGIGLFQSKMIVEAHGGNIQVTSDLGKGTTFRVFLPLKTPAV